MRLDKNFPNNKPENKAKILSMKGIPVQHQTLGICYAYAATQMVDAVRKTHQRVFGKKPDNHISSPVFTAINHTSNWSHGGVTLTNGSPDYPFEGGSLCDAFESAQSVGTCPKANIEKFYIDKGMTEKEFFNLLYEAEKKIMDVQVKEWSSHTVFKRPEGADTVWDQTAYVRNRINYLEVSSSNRVIESCSNDIRDQLYEDLEGIFGSLMPSKFIFDTFYSKDMFDSPLQLSLLFKFICPKENRDSVPWTASCTDYTVADAYRESSSSIPFTLKILEKLKSKSMPVGISYCSKVLGRGKSFSGIDSKSKGKVVYKKDSKGNSMCGNHASLIIGSRFNAKDKTCEFLIRNTWGSNYKAHSDFESEGGNIWVDHKTLEKNLYRIQHL